MAPALVTVPIWFTVAAAKRVASAKGVASVAVFGPSGMRSTVPVMALDASWDTKTLATSIVNATPGAIGDSTRLQTAFEAAA